MKARLARMLKNDALLAKLMGPGLISLVVKVTSAGLSYLMLVAFARMLPAEDYGYFGVMTNVAIVVSTICMLGLPLGAMRFWPAHMERKEPELAKGFVQSSQKLLAWVSVGLLFIALALTWTGLSTRFFGFTSGALLVAVFATLLALSEFLSSLLRAQNLTAWALVPRDILWRVFAPFAAGAVLYFSGLASGQIAILCCVVVLGVLTLVQFGIAWRATQRIVGNIAARTNWQSWRGPLIPLAGASVLFAMVQQLDVVVVGSLLGPIEAGSYFAAQKTASLMGLVMIAGGMVAAPLMSAAFQGGRIMELQRICKFLSVAIAGVTLCGFGLLAIIGDRLLALFDPAYVSQYGLLMVLALGYAIDALAGPTAYLMQMTKLESAYLKIMAMSYFVVLALQLALVPHYGAVAAAAATTIGYVIWNVTAIFLLRREVGVDSSLFSFFLAPKPGKP
jgi:O-antigen/teichoic acid export membrane protein